MRGELYNAIRQRLAPLPDIFLGGVHEFCEMSIFLDENCGAVYDSLSQKIRVMSEPWVAENIHCPSCGDKLLRAENNAQVKDFYCSGCPEQFELKSQGRKWGKKAMGGAYKAMIGRISGANRPNFLFLHYNKEQNFRIENLFCLPKQFLTVEVIEKRKPLSQNARRPNWVGCNILLEKIPESGRIFYVRNAIPAPTTEVRALYSKTIFLKAEIKGRGWLLDIMRLIERHGKADFCLADIYAFEGELQKRHPRNHNIQAKIRQQLQFLRNKGYLRFSGNSHYSLT